MLKIYFKSDRCRTKYLIKQGEIKMRYSKVILMGLLSAVLMIGINYSAFAESSTTNASVTFQALETGALSLDKVPDAFDFGTQTLSSQPQDDTLGTGTNPALTVTDNRGTGAGWHVTVQADKLHTLSGKTLNGGNIIIDQAQNINGNGSISDPPAAQSVTADTYDGSGNPVPVTIVGAQADQHQGMGTWDINWTGDQIHLKISPGEAYSEAYSATITWTLNDTPVQ